MLMFLPMFGGGYGGAASEPKYRARTILLAASVVPFAALEVIGYVCNGARGLLLAPCVTMLTLVIFFIMSLAIDALNHSLQHEGLKAGVFTAAYVILFLMAVAILIGGGMLAFFVSLCS